MARTAQTEMTKIAKGLTVSSNNIVSEVMSWCELITRWQCIFVWYRTFLDNR